MPGPTAAPTPIPLPPGTPVSGGHPIIAPENAGQLVELARWGEGMAAATWWTRDGKWLAVQSRLGVRVYDAQTLTPGRLVEEARVDEMGLSAVARDLSLAVRVEEGAMWRVDLSTGESLPPLPLPAEWVEPVDIAIAPDGRLLAVAKPRQVLLLDAATGQTRQTLELHSASRPEAPYSFGTMVAFSQDGHLLVTWAEDTLIELWDVASGERLLEVFAQTSSFPAQSVALSGDNRILARGVGSKTMLYDVQSGTLVRTLDCRGTSAIALAPKGDRLATLTFNGVEIWDTGTGQQQKVLDAGQQQEVAWTPAIMMGQGHLAFSPDGTRLAVVAGNLEDGPAVKVWDPASGALVRALAGYGEWINSVAFGPDSSTLAWGGFEPTVRMVNLTTGREIRSVRLQQYSAEAVAFSPDGAVLLASDYEVEWWEASTGKSLRAGRPDRIGTFVAFLPDGKSMLVHDLLGTFSIVTVPKAQVLRSFTAPAVDIRQAAVSSDGTVLAISVSGTGQISLWGVNSGTELRTLPGHLEGISGLAFSPDGAWLASIGYAEAEPAARIWDVATGREIVQLVADTLTLGTAVAFSPDGKVLATAGYDGIVLWDTSTWRQLAALTGFYWRITTVAFSPDGRLLASGGGDGAVRVWGVK